MTRTAQYVHGLRAALQAATPSLPARIELSPVRAAARDSVPMLRVLPGREVIGASTLSCTTHIREVQLWVHTAGDDHVDLAEAVFGAAHPIVMRYQADGLVQVEEGNTDEPRYSEGDLTRQVVVKRYLLTYQTDEHSLCE